MVRSVLLPVMARQLLKGPPDRTRQYHAKRGLCVRVVGFDVYALGNALVIGARRWSYFVSSFLVTPSSRSRSASKRLSRAFSRSSSISRAASAVLMSPYYLRQR